ncbi:MAG TPA: ATP-binding protein [Candidatus Sulfotelmatobacter sp.]
MKLEFAPPATPPGVASVARTYFKFTATPTWPHAVSISPLGIVAIGAITLIILTWAVCAHFASRRTAAQAKELEHRIVERTTELTAVNEQLRKEILERQRAQDALREPEEKFHQLADNIQQIFWMVDAVTKQAIYVNPAFEQITGRTMASLLGAPLSYREIIHSDDREQVLSALDEAAKTGGFDEEFRIVRPDRTLRWVAAQGFPIRDQQNNVYRVAGVLQDITRRKSAEQALHESRTELARVTRTVTMNELAASISHEIKQPLTAIVTAGQSALRWLDHQPPNVEEAREGITAVIRDANHASAVIERFRSLLKGSPPPQLQALKLDELIREALLLVANDLIKAEVVVRTALADDLPPVLGDRVLLQQVILNLTTNAIDAMRAVTGRPRELIIRSTKEREHVLIQMQDSGKGIGSEQLERIFEPFLTTKPEGIGLGLPISRSMIESLGGRLWATSASPLGATFHFTLPAADRLHE